MRKKLIAGNWKMNTNLTNSLELVNGILNLIHDVKKTEVLFCPPFTNLFPVSEIIKNTNVQLGAQNCEYRPSGAFTGEISTEMILSVGCSYVIIGHSERRTIYGETDETVNLKVKAALNTGLKPIICIGETLAERNEGNTFEVLKKQISIAYKDIDQNSIKNLVIAYEPVWAIGTGISATNEQAGEAHNWIRNFLKENYGNDASQIRILYGGSMNDKNCSDLLKLPDVDGGLIGGASLKPEQFVQIILAAENLS